MQEQKHSRRKCCQICGKEFLSKDLYPNSLIRSAVMKTGKKVYPQMTEDGFICFDDLRRLGAMHFEEVLKKERGSLSELEKEVLESIKDHELLAEDVNKEFEKKLTFGEKLADKMAQFGGSWSFICLFGCLLFFWMGINSLQYFYLPFDPYPFIFLNLVLSCLAALQAPIIMMSQNRQAAKERLSMENDYVVNLKAELQVRQLNARLELFMKHHWQRMHEIIRMQEEILEEIGHRLSEKKKKL